MANGGCNERENLFEIGWTAIENIEWTVFCLGRIVGFSRGHYVKRMFFPYAFCSDEQFEFLFFYNFNGKNWFKNNSEDACRRTTDFVD